MALVAQVTHDIHFCGRLDERSRKGECLHPKVAGQASRKRTVCYCWTFHDLAAALTAVRR